MPIKLTHRVGTSADISAIDAGFKAIELGSTVSGEPLYLAPSYREVTRETHNVANGSENVVIKMVKVL